ncbi:unnamed protein product [Malus baccata var. baccata]
MLDASAGGALVDKTPTAAKTLIANRTLNAQQYEGVGQRSTTRQHQVNEVSAITELQNQMANLTTLLSQVVEGPKVQNVSACGVCSMQGHPTDTCPQLIENGGWETLNAVGFGQQYQQRNDPFSNTYNPGWRDHPNFKWREPQQGQQQNTFRRQPPSFYQKPFAPNQTQIQSAPTNSGTSLDNDTILKLLNTLSQGQDNQTTALQSQANRVDHLEKQIGQIAEFVGQFRDQGRLPSSTVANPKGGFETAKAIALRSGKQVGTETQAIQVKKRMKSYCLRKNPKPQPRQGWDNLCRSHLAFPTHIIRPRLKQSKKEENKKDILETFRKVQVNIPLLDAIKQVPRYAKFLKELCTTRRIISNKAVVQVSENVSAVLQRKLPPKCKDPGSFTIPCVIGNTKFEHAMLDLGASINVMPYSIYASMNLGELKNDGVIIQLADRSNAYPKGVLEDVLVQVDNLIFPVDFYVLEVEDSPNVTPLPILLGRPFMKTARTKIDVFKGTLTMEFDGEIINFNISTAMKFPKDDHSCFSIDVLDELAQDYLDMLEDDPFETTIAQGIGAKPNLAVPKEEHAELVAALELLPQHRGKPSNPIPIPVSTNTLLPSVIQAPVLDLKPLPDHLKYVFLGDEETLPVIVSSSLTALDEEKLIRVLKEHKTAIGWTLADIKGISPTTCMHRIFLEEGAKPTREAQRRLNPPMMEVVKKEIIKLLDCGVIYPISDSRWVSPVQVVPKKSGVTVVKNAEDELVPTRIQTVCFVPFQVLETKYAKKCEMEHFRAKLSWNVVYANGAQEMDEFEALKYLLTKKEAKPRLIRWMLLLQEFDIEIRDKKGSENVVADHLSRLVHEEDVVPIPETFPDEQLMSIEVSMPWKPCLSRKLHVSRNPSSIRTPTLIRNPSSFRNPSFKPFPTSTRKLCIFNSSTLKRLPSFIHPSNSSIPCASYA